MMILFILITLQFTMAATVGGNSSIYTFEITDCQADYITVGCNQTTIRYECDINNPQFITNIKYKINDVLYTTTKSGLNYYVDYIKVQQIITINTTINHTDVYITDTNSNIAHYENLYTNVSHDCVVCTDVGYIENCTVYDNRTIYHIYQPYGCEVDYNETVSCNYCSEDVEQILGECSVTNEQTMNYTDNNYENCCVITGLISDCSILFPPYNNTIIQSCNYTCNEIWQPIYECDSENNGFKYYEQITNCTVIDELPADNGTYYNCAYEPEGMIIGYDNYMDVGTIEKIEVIITENNTRVDNTTQYTEIKFDNSTYIMLYDETEKLFYIYITETIERDIPFIIIYWNSYGSNNTKNGTGIMKWRKSFDIDLIFYKQDVNNPDSQPTIYKNDFHYVYMLPVNESTIIGISTTKIGDIAYLDSMVNWIPGYGGNLVPKKILDIQTAYWGKYEDGKATIKLYESGNYTLHLITNKMVGGEWQYEFVYPQFKSAKYKSRIGIIEITEEISSEYNVYMDVWEVFKFKMMMNLFYWIVVFGLYFVLLFILTRSVMSPTAYIGVTIGYFTFMKIIGVMIF